MRVFLFVFAAALAVVAFGPVGLAIAVAGVGVLSALARGAFEAGAARSMVRW